MAHSLEVRVPFLDHRLVEWAARVPSAMKVHRGVTKRVLKEAGIRLLPPETVNKRKVGFFRSALEVWLDAQLAGTGADRLRARDAPYRDFLDGAAVERLLADYRREPSEDRSRLLFAILLLESWLTSFVQRAHSEQPA
jgi:asparagine synthase (glutamine-hydrolysing)